MVTTEAQRSYFRKYYQQHKNEISVSRKQYYLDNKSKYEKYNESDYVRTRTLHNRYKLSIDDYEKMVVEQGSRCAICGTDNPGRKSKNNHWFIDHCHETNKIRGLLCHKCNLGLGHFNDNIDLMEKAIEYIRRFKNA